MQWFKVPPKIYFESGSIKYLSKMSGITNAFIVTDSSMLKLGYVDKVIYQLEKHANHIHFEIFSEVEPDPSFDTIDRGVKAMGHFTPDVIIALGGGSVIDAAIVAQVCDGAVLVIAANQVSYKFAQNVMGQLKKTKVKIIGSVLNKVDLSENGYYGRYYGKYYGKYYGSYYGHYNSEESPDKSFEKARNASSARKNTNNASKPVKRQAGSVGEVAARKKANVAGNNTGVRKKPSADEFDGDFLMDYDEK